MKKNSYAKKSRSSSSKQLRSEDFQRVVKTICEKQSPAPFGQELIAAKMPSPIILFGNQHVRTRRIIDWIHESLFSKDNAEYIAYFGAELTSKKNLEPISQSLLTQSLFATETLLVIYDSDQIKAPVAKELAKILQIKNDSTVVIICSEDNSKKTSLAGVLAENATRIDIAELSGTQLHRWIEKEARQVGAKGFESGAVELLIKYFGSDTTHQAREIEKLALLTDPDTLISKSLVHQLSFQSPDVTSFELMKKIGRRDVSGACVQALSLVDQGMHPMQISYFLSRCVRTLLARNATEAKDQLATEFTNYWFTKNLSGLERSFSEKNTNECLEALSSLDFNLKDSTFSDKMALTIAVQRLAGRRNYQLRAAK